MRTLIQMGPIILSIEHCSGFLPCVLGHSGYHWALLILWNSLFPLFLSYHTYQKPNPCPACLEVAVKNKWQREFCQKILHDCKKVTPQKRMSPAWIISTFLSAANAHGSTQAEFYLNMYPNLTEITLMKYYLWNLTQDAKRWENCKSHNVDHSVSFNLIFCASCRFATRAHWPTIQEVNFSCSWLFRTCNVPSGNCAWKLLIFTQCKELPSPIWLLELIHSAKECVRSPFLMTHHGSGQKPLWLSPWLWLGNQL